jgi:hypothetical protein
VSGPHRARLAAVALVIAVLPVVRGTATGAQDATGLRLVRQTVEVRPGEAFEIVVTTAGGALPPDGELGVTLFGRLENPRDDLDLTLFAGQPPTGTMSFFTIPLSDLPRGDAGQMTVTVPVVGRGEDRPDHGFRLSNPGLYPVRLEVIGADDEVLASLLTTVARPRTEDGAARRFPVALVVRRTAPPALQPDGSVLVDPVHQQELSAMAELLARRPDLPFTVALPPELLAAASTSGVPGATSVVAELAASVGGREVLASTFVTMDPTASARSSLTPTFTDQLTEGEEALTATLQTSRTSRAEWFHDGPIGTEGVELLRSLGVRGLVLPVEALAPAQPDDRIDINHPIPLAVGTAASMQAAVMDPGVRGALATPGDDPALTAYLAVARLLASDFAWPVEDEVPRGAVVGPPIAAPLDSLVLGTFIDLLATTPTLRPVTVEEWFRTVASGPLVGEAADLAPAETADLAPLALRLAASSVEIDDVSAMAVERPELSEQLHTLTERTVAAELDDAGRDAYFGAVDTQLATITGAVLPVEADRFTMTGREATLPLTIRTSTDEPLRLRVRLSSPKLTFPDGEQLVTVAREARVEFPVEARTNGTFSVTVDLLTPQQGRPLVTPTQVTVAAASFTGLGIALTIAAGLVLVAWWVQHARRAAARRQSGLAQEREVHPSASTSEGAGPHG